MAVTLTPAYNLSTKIYCQNRSYPHHSIFHNELFIFRFDMFKCTSFDVGFEYLYPGCDWLTVEAEHERTRLK